MQGRATSTLTRLIHAVGRKHSNIFVAWTKETEAAAKVVCRRLQSQGLSAWMSIHMEAGSRFRDEVRWSIRNSDLVIAILPMEPSKWLTAEAGLAYFEEKLLPIGIDQACTVEPFSELQTYVLSSEDVTAGTGSTLDELVILVNKRLGFAPDNVFVAAIIRLFNLAFFFGIPLIGALIVCILLVLALFANWTGSTPTPDIALHLWKTGHTVLGSIVYGGAAFIALLFAQSNTIRSLAGRHFSFRTARQMFTIWFALAAVQFVVGLYLLQASTKYGRGDDWVFASVTIYMTALIFALAAFILHFIAHRKTGRGEIFGKAGRYALLGNVLFSSVLVALTAVVVLMSLRGELTAARHIGRIVVQ